MGYPLRYSNVTERGKWVSSSSGWRRPSSRPSSPTPLIQGHHRRRPPRSPLRQPLRVANCTEVDTPYLDYVKLTRGHRDPSLEVRAPGVLTGERALPRLDDNDGSRRPTTGSRCSPCPATSTGRRPILGTHLLVAHQGAFKWSIPDRGNPETATESPRRIRQLYVRLSCGVEG